MLLPGREGEDSVLKVQGKGSPMVPVPAKLLHKLTKDRGLSGVGVSGAVSKAFRRLSGSVSAVPIKLTRHEFHGFPQRLPLFPGILEPAHDRHSPSIKDEHAVVAFPHACRNQVANRVKPSKRLPVAEPQRLTNFLERRHLLLPFRKGA